MRWSCSLLLLAAPCGAMAPCGRASRSEHRSVFCFWIHRQKPKRIPSLSGIESPMIRIVSAVASENSDSPTSGTFRRGERILFGFLTNGSKKVLLYSVPLDSERASLIFWVHPLGTRGASVRQADCGQWWRQGGGASGALGTADGGPPRQSGTCDGKRHFVSGFVVVVRSL